ncbi:pentatricopeptide repeat-containing protein At3g60050 [Medicago truncatula]|uniref:pentatricopeptide repeat-containing protein At3g60050 n=1 Tax=Medicago truncatula TaxID=3880 RepID=UPI0019686EE6|nr:pentatricopeptide repeat-containing protein At3g60050 [Medicago truncatula]
MHGSFLIRCMIEVNLPILSHTIPYCMLYAKIIKLTRQLHWSRKLKTKAFNQINTYNILIDGLCKEGRLENAQVIFQDLLIKGYKVKVWTYNTMINGLCLEGLFDEAMTLLEKMEDNGCTPDVVTYETIIYALFKNDENDKAEKLLREMITRGLL